MQFKANKCSLWFQMDLFCSLCGLSCDLTLPAFTSERKGILPPSYMVVPVTLKLRNSQERLSDSIDHASLWSLLPQLGDLKNKRSAKALLLWLPQTTTLSRPLSFFLCPTFFTADYRTRFPGNERGRN